MRHLKTTLAVLGAATILVLAANTVAFAATGGKFFLGKSNFANKQTTLTRTTNGPVLKLNAKQATGAPLAVRGTGKVVGLNADRVDGVDSTTMLTTGYVFTKHVAIGTSSTTLDIPLPTGNYTLGYSAYLIGAQNTWVACYFWKLPPVGSSSYFGESRFTAGTDFPGLGGYGFVAKTAGTTIRLKCSAGTTFTTSSDEPIQIVATRVDKVAATTALRSIPSGARQR